MRDRHVGCLVVVQEVSPQESQVVGMLTDRDIALGVVAAQADAQALRVADLMSRDVVTVREHDSVLDALATMRRKGVRRLPVVGPQDRLLGLLAVEDLLMALSRQIQALAGIVGAAQRHEEFEPL
jgi:CBS domain-containing protein